MGCTNPTALNFNPSATCDDGSCIFSCPARCDDGDCAGIETWDGIACQCIVDPGCNDGDCSNGIETWDGCQCTPPVNPGCNDGDCSNGVETPVHVNPGCMMARL
ncbi:MAG: hypothetical protein R2798_07845 [Chitinophagales bacterium]